MAFTEEARAARDAKLDALHEQLTGAVESLVSGDDWKQALQFAARFRARSFNNTLLIFAQHQSAFEAGRVPEPVPTYVAGFTMADTWPTGREGPVGVHDPRPGDRQVRIVHPEGRGIVAPARTVREAEAG